MLRPGEVRKRPEAGRSQARPGVFPLDALTHAKQKFQTLPTPLGAPPYHIDLETMVPGVTADASALGKLVLHCVGDTGGVRSPQFQEGVAAAMEADLGLAEAERPRFFYHLGDVVYFNGQIGDYYAQFYEPYSHYTAPIIAIPGNHDGDPATAQQTSLDGWVRYFMQPAPVVQPESGDAPRATLSLPNPYFTLEAPFVTLVGMYTNVPEGGSVDSVQQQWLTNELATAPMDKALIVALHHPIYSFDSYHSGSAAMADVLEKAINDSRRVPNMVISAHVHDFQRIEKQVVPGATASAKKGKPKGTAAPHETVGVTPFMVCGNGGYYGLHALSSAPGTEDPATGAKLIYGEDTFYGYMTLTIDAEAIRGTTTAVLPRAKDPAAPPPPDTFSYPTAAVVLPEGAMVDL